MLGPICANFVQISVNRITVAANTRKGGFSVYSNPFSDLYMLSKGTSIAAGEPIHVGDHAVLVVPVSQKCVHQEVEPEEPERIRTSDLLLRRQTA